MDRWKTVCYFFIKKVKKSIDKISGEGGVYIYIY